MGTEFIAKTRKTAKKYLDRRRGELCAPKLFDVSPETLARQFVATAEAKADLHPGDPLQIEASGSGIILRRAGARCRPKRLSAPQSEKGSRPSGGVLPWCGQLGP